jgi:hypothetical protein
MTLRVTFDSNAWEKIIDEIDHPLRCMIASRKIAPFLCEIAITLESIQKKERDSFTRNYSPRVTEELPAADDDTEREEFKIRLTFGPDNDAHPGLHPALREKLSFAQDLGFRILPMTNIGTVRCHEIEDSMKLKFSDTDEFWNYAEKLAECSEFIETLGSGGAAYHRMATDLRNNIQMNNSFESIQFTRKFSAAVSEWCDGGSLAAHYAIGNDIFCTQDQGRNAGRSSIFHSENFRILSKRFSIKKMTLEELTSALV